MFLKEENKRSTKNQKTLLHQKTNKQKKQVFH